MKSIRIIENKKRDAARDNRELFTVLRYYCSRLKIIRRLKRGEMLSYEAADVNNLVL